MSTFSSPNRVVWDYFHSLRLIVQAAKTASGPDIARQQSALALIMSVTVVEVFFNIWFRVRVEEPANLAHRESLLKDLANRKSIESKLNNWPKRYLGKTLDLTTGAGAAFAEVKRKRNAIVHFTSSHETQSFDAFIIHGLADTSEYDSLTAEDASCALQAAQGLISKIFELAGLTPNQVSSAMHAWTGLTPA